MRARDLIDSHMNVEQRLRMLELRRAEGQGALARNAQHLDAIAEWLSIPSAVPPSEFSVGRAAAALWAAEQALDDPFFHGLMRVVREVCAAIAPLRTAGDITLNQYEPRPHQLSPDTSGYSGIDGSAAASPRFILMQNAPGWYYKVLVPGAPRVASYSTGVHSVPFGSPGLVEETGRSASVGIALGLWSSFSFIGATPPNIVLRAESLGHPFDPGDPADVYGPTFDSYGLTDAFGTVISGYSRGSALFEDAVHGNVTNPSPPPAVLEDVIVSKTSVKTAGATIIQDPGDVEFYPLPYKPDAPPKGIPMSGVEQDDMLPPPSGVPAPEQPIVDYQSNVIGFYYKEEPQPDINPVIYSFDAMSVYSWGAPVRAVDMAGVDRLNPPDSMLGVWSEYRWGVQNGDFAEDSTDTGFTTTFEAVRERVMLGIIPSQIMDWVTPILAKVSAAGPAYEHEWVKQTGMHGDVWATKRYGITTLRGDAIADSGGGFGFLDIGLIDPDVTARRFVVPVLGDDEQIDVTFYNGPGAIAVALPFSGGEGMRITLDGIQFPCPT
jgi:hypothetical protein